MFICSKCRQQVAVSAASTSMCPACGESHLLDGRFHLTSKLRERAACTVWLGREGDGRTVRVDELSLARFDEGARDQLVERIQDLAGQDSPHHARLLTTEFTDDDRFGPRCFAIFDQPGGQTLKERLEKEPLEEGDALRILVGAARALAWQHTRSTARVHGGVRPDNVVLVGGKKVVLTGHTWLTQLVQGELTGPLSVPSTACLVAPEVLHGGVDAASPTSDVFALGGLLMAMLTGDDPDGYAERDGTVRWREVADLDTKAGKLLAHLLHPDPAKRLADGVAVLGACGRLPDVAELDVLVVGAGKKGSHDSLEAALDSAGTDTAIVLRPGTWAAVPRLVGTQRILGNRWRSKDITVSLDAEDTATLEHHASLVGLTLQGSKSDPALRVEGGQVAVSQCVIKGGARGVQVREGTARFDRCDIDADKAVVSTGETCWLLRSSVVGKTSAVSASAGLVQGNRGWWHASFSAVEATGEAVVRIAHAVIGPAAESVLVARDKAKVVVVGSVVQGADTAESTHGDGKVVHLGTGYRQVDRAREDDGVLHRWPRRNEGVWDGMGPAEPVEEGPRHPVAKGESSRKMVMDAVVAQRPPVGQLRSPLSRAQAEAILRASIQEMDHSLLPGARADITELRGELLHAWVFTGAEGPVLVGPRHFDAPPFTPDELESPTDHRPRWSDCRGRLAVSAAALDPWLAAQGARLDDIEARPLRDALKDKMGRLGLRAGLVHRFDDVLLSLDSDRLGAADHTVRYDLEVRYNRAEWAGPQGHSALAWEVGRLPERGDGHSVEVARLTWARVWARVGGLPVGFLVGKWPRMYEGHDPADAIARTRLSLLRKDFTSDDDDNELPLKPDVVRQRLMSALEQWPFVGGDPDAVCAFVTLWAKHGKHLEDTEEEVDAVCEALARRKVLADHLGDKGLTPARIRSSFEEGAAAWKRRDEVLTSGAVHALNTSKAFGVLAVLGLIGIVIAAMMPEPPPPPPPPPPDATTVVSVSAPQCKGTDKIVFEAQANGVGSLGLVLAETAAAHPTRDGWFEIHAFKTLNEEHVGRAVLKRVYKPDQVKSGATLFRCTDDMLNRLTYEVYLFNTDDKGELVPVECVMWGHQPGFSGTHEVTGVTVSGEHCRLITPE